MEYLFELSESENHPIDLKMKICNLDYLRTHAPNKPKFVTEMIQLFLKQTPEYILGMKSCIKTDNWDGLQRYTHKLRPSIDYFGLPKEIADSAKLLDEYATKKEHLNMIPDLFLKIEKTFQLAYVELEEELKNNV